MPGTTNHLVASAKKLSVPAAMAGAFVLGAAFFAGHGGCMPRPHMPPLDDNSIVGTDLARPRHGSRGVEGYARSGQRGGHVARAQRRRADDDGRGSAATRSAGQMQQLPPGLRQFFGT